MYFGNQTMSLEDISALPALEYSPATVSSEDWEQAPIHIWGCEVGLSSDPTLLAATQGVEVSALQYTARVVKGNGEVVDQWISEDWSSEYALAIPAYIGGPAEAELYSTRADLGEPVVVHPQPLADALETVTGQISCYPGGPTSNQTTDVPRIAGDAE